MRTWEGGTQCHSLRIGLIVSQFNRPITEGLLNGALRTLNQCGLKPSNIELVKVPGAFEIPGMAQHMGRLQRFDALICLGAVIQGETPHFQYICSEVSRGISQVALDLNMPVIFGILTTHSVEQAIARAGANRNKGSEAAVAAIEMANLYKNVQ
ncbi:MAG: 6,7-dimethyl-8-ribityllumazine synthase [Nitrospiria bacterium]